MSTMTDSRSDTGRGRFHSRCADILTSRRSTSLRPPTPNDETDDKADHDDTTDNGYRYDVETSVKTIAVDIRRRRRQGSGTSSFKLSGGMFSIGHGCQQSSQLLTNNSYDDRVTSCVWNIALSYGIDIDK